MVQRENWVEIYINDCTDIFIGKLQEHITNSSSHVRIKQNDIKGKAWITGGLVRTVQEKEKLFKIMRKNNTEEKIK